jgi:organic radical activating enzyme
VSAAEPNLVEIFSSVQGEGPHVGLRTIFVRFGECDLRCRWCDSPNTWARAERCRIESEPGSGRFHEVANPLPIEAVIEAVRALDASHHAFVSLTGGEPLLQPDAVRALAPALRALGPRIHLETHGAAPDALALVVDAIDVVSMDWKLASEVRRASDPARGPARDFVSEHTIFLEIARRAPETIVKLVITPRSTDEEIDQALACVARVHPDACVVLQPVTPCGGVKESVSAERMLALVARAATRVAHVRVIPQTHKLLGAL